MSDKAKDCFFEMLNNIKSFHLELEGLGYDIDTMKFEIKKIKEEDSDD